MNFSSLFHLPIFMVLSEKIEEILTHLNPLTALHPLIFFLLFALFFLSGANALLFGDGKLASLVGSLVLIALALLIGLSLVEEIEPLKAALHSLFNGKADLLF